MLTLAPYGSPAFNAELGTALRALGADIAAAVGSNLEAVLLGGGYGRGEGAVVREQGQERAYNDVDLLLVVRRPHLPRAALDAVRERHEAALGIEVDIGRPLTRRGMRHWSCCLRWQELAAGHVVLYGPDDIVRSNAPVTLRLPLPVVEATRLLLNRGAGLLWAMRVARGVAAAPDPDFVRRNRYKCLQALGDALLITHRRAQVSYLGRAERFEKLLSDVPELRRFDLRASYREALDFKLRPQAVPLSQPRFADLAALAEQWGKVLLYVERLRLGGTWSSIDAYVAWRGAREAEFDTLRAWPRNLTRAVRIGTLSLSEPRERLYRELPPLLGLTLEHQDAWSKRSARFLGRWQATS